MMKKKTSKLLLLTNDFVGFLSFNQHFLVDIECLLRPEAATENSILLARMAIIQRKRCLRSRKLIGSIPNILKT